MEYLHRLHSGKLCETILFDSMDSCMDPNVNSVESLSPNVMDTV